MSPQIACLRGYIIALVAFVWLFSTTYLQITCLTGCKVTLVTFVRLFYTVHFQMCLHIVRPRECKVTLVAFVWLFFTVCFQMCPQMAYPKRSKVTLVEFVQLFSTRRFQMCLKTTCIIADIVTLRCFTKTCFLRNKMAQPALQVFGGWFEGIQKDFWFSFRGCTSQAMFCLGDHGALF